MTEDSPCVGICVLEDDICIGCGRTSAEIFSAGVAAGYGPAATAEAAEPDED